MTIGKKTFRSRWAAIVRDRRGAIAILFAFSSFALLGFAGLVVDMGFWYGTHGALQVAADAGAMAAARTFPYSYSSSTSFLQIVAQNAADQASTSLQTNPTVTVSVAGSGTGRIVTVVATAPEQLFFSEIVGHASGTISASAEASEAGTESACILALDQGNADAVYINDTAATVNSPNCAIYSDGGVKNKNGTINTQVIGAYGSIAGNYESQTELLANTGNVVTDPYDTLPAPSTTSPMISDYSSPSGQSLGDTKTCQSSNPPAGSIYEMSPGTYDGGIDISKNSCVNFQPGVYYLYNGNLTFNGGSVITGTGVTFYFGGPNPGTIDWLGNGSSVSLTAPTSGTYAGILFYQSQNTPLDTSCNNPGTTPGGSCAYISGDSSYNLSGALYFPETGVVFYGNSTSGPTVSSASAGVGVNIVAQTVQIGGDATLNTGDPVSNGTNVGGTPYLSG